jgi:hypothetical protein
MDQSQKAAEPIKAVAPATFIREMANPESDPAKDSPEAVENRRRAGAEISMIFELKDSRAFQWFMSEFIDKPYREAFDKLRDPRLRQKEESLETIQTNYVALRAVKAGMIEREIAHREQIDTNDPEVVRLRELLAAL